MIGFSDGKAQTVVFLAIIAVAVIAWNVFALYFWGPQATISRVVADSSRQYPMIPFLIGFVVGFVSGHWFWNIHS